MSIWNNVTLVFVTVYLVLMYSPFLLDISPKAYSFPFREFKGPLAENYKLSEAEHLFTGVLEGPESIVFHEGYLYTGVAGGKIVKIKDNNVTTVAETGLPCRMPYQERVCGRPLGMRKGKDGLLYVIDAYYGIYTMDFATGALINILPSDVLIEGQRLNFPDDLDIDDEGNIYFTDASTRWDLSSMFYMMFEYEEGGRVIRFNTKTGENEVLLSKLSFPNGIQLSKNKRHLLICEIMNRRILKFNLKGENKGKLEIFADNLPAEPDNIRPSKNGYWVAFTSARNETNKFLPDLLAPHTTFKFFFARLVHLICSVFKLIADVMPYHDLKEFTYKLLRGDFFLSLIPRHGLVIEFDEDGQILRSFHSPDGKTYDLSEVREHEGYLYLGSFLNPYLGRLKL